MIQEINCKNGLRILIYPVPNRNIVGACLFVKCGYFHDPPQYLGISHILEHAIFEGSMRFPTPDKAAMKYGTYFEGMTEKEWTRYWFVCLKKDFNSVLKILLDIIFNPLLEESAIEKVKQIVIGGTGEKKFFLPEELAEFNWNKLFFGSPCIELWDERDKILNIPFEKFKEHHKNFYSPENSVLVIVGDVKLNVNEAEKFVSNKTFVSPQMYIQEAPKSHFIFEHSKSKKSGVTIGFVTEYNEELEAVLDILKFVLGNYPESLLWELSLGLCEEVGSTTKVFHSLNKIAFFLNLTILPSKEEELFYNLSLYIKNMKKLGVKEEITEQFKKVAIVELYEIKENIRKALYWLGRKNIYKKGILDFSEKINKIEIITEKEIKKNINKLFSPTNTFISLVCKSYKSVTLLTTD